jgi:hypothetical protein
MSDRVCPLHGFTPTPDRPIPPPTCPECNQADIARLVPTKPLLPAKMAGRNNPRPAPTCTEILRDGLPCRTHEKEDRLCAYHLRKRDLRAAEIFTPSLDEPEEDSRAPVNEDDDRPRLRPTNVRGQLAADTTEEYEKLRDALFAALDAERETFATCQKCHHRTRVMVPDNSARLKAIEILLREGFGKSPDAAKVTAAKTSADLSELTDEELLALAGLDSFDDLMPERERLGEPTEGEKLLNRRP